MSRGNIRLIGKSILDLLPQQSSTIITDQKMLRKILNLTYDITLLLKEALENFYIYHDYQYFDPQVGDTACQVRAYIFLILSNKKINVKKIAGRIRCFDGIKDILCNLKKQYHKDMHGFKNISIIDFFDKKEIYFNITLRELFLAESYIMSMFKDIKDDNFIIDKYKISEYFSVPKKTSEKIIDKYQLFLSKMSCVFIKKIAKYTNIHNSDYVNFFSSLERYEGKIFYPLYFYTKVIFSHFKKNKYHIVMVFQDLQKRPKNNIKILFKHGNDSGEYLSQLDNDVLGNDTCLVVTCNCTSIFSFSAQEFIQVLNHFGLFKILFMNVAAHPQRIGGQGTDSSDQLLSDDVKPLPKEEEMLQEFITLRNAAMLYGFCQANSSLLSIKHIYFEKLSNLYRQPFIKSANLIDELA